MRTWIVIAVSALLGSATSTAADPALDSLWPNADGLRWDYTFTITESLGSSFSSPAFLQLAGTVSTAGGTAQLLVGSHDTPPAKTGPAGLDPLLRSIWRARPDLRAVIERQARLAAVTDWQPLLLHSGYFMKSTASIQMWQPDWDHPTWTYLTNDLALGATFTHQLVPELADDVFLRGTVDAVDATVMTAAGTFTNAVRMRYTVDYGWSAAVDSDGTLIGRFRAETRGFVHFVPEIGPADHQEEFVQYAEIDCAPGSCPQDWQDLLGAAVETMTLSLARTPSGITAGSWTAIKGLFR